MVELKGTGVALVALAMLVGGAASAKESEETQAPPLTAELINGAVPVPATAEPKDGETKSGTGKDGEKKSGAAKDGEKTANAAEDEDRPDPLTIKVQVLLDRAHFSPGAIDGLVGDNFEGALAAFASQNGLDKPKRPTQAVLDKLQAASQGPVVTDYTITDADVAGPYVDRIPADMEAQADLDRLGYTNIREKLAERFHMTRALLDALNPDANFEKAGTVIQVAAVAPMGIDKPDAKDLPREPVVERVEVQKRSHDVRAFGKDGKLLGYYPASIGSTEKPAPSGTTTVKGVAFDPTYTYNPKYGFKGVESHSKFSIKGGPNNPVGLVWIDLAIPSYGIHGTPEPRLIGKTESHGCIRLTNWDARDLAAQVARGAEVAFTDD